MRQVVLFGFSFVLWLLLAWPVGTQDVVIGVLCAAVVAFVMKEITTEKFGRWVSPVRIFWFVSYVFVLAYYIMKANLDVAYRVLHPSMPIRPGIVKVKTNLKTPSAITALANSITLTPGTLTVEASAEGTLYVHWINVKAEDIEGATKHIVERFEWFITRIFE